MKFALLTVMIASGCVTPIPLGQNQKCASMNMVKADTEEGDEESPQCVQPEDKVQQCKLSKHKEAAMMKEIYNENCCGAKNTVIIAGYIFYIVPGIVAQVIMNQTRNNTNDEANEISKSASECEAH